MPWIDETFVGCQTLTYTHMNGIQDNFAAVAAQNSGAPVVTFPNSVLNADAGIATVEVGSFGSINVSSGLATDNTVSIFGGINFPHFMLRYNAANPPVIVRQTNVACLQRVGTGLYVIQLTTAFTNSEYYILNGGSAIGGGSPRAPLFIQESSTLSRVAIRQTDLAGGGASDFGKANTIFGVGD